MPLELQLMTRKSCSQPASKIGFCRRAVAHNFQAHYLRRDGAVALPRRNDWVFSISAAKIGRLQEPRIPQKRALSAAGLPASTLRELRPAFVTLSE
jgi:hypothetical protein